MSVKIKIPWTDPRGIAHEEIREVALAEVQQVDDKRIWVSAADFRFSSDGASYIVSHPGNFEAQPNAFSVGGTGVVEAYARAPFPVGSIITGLAARLECEAPGDPEISIELYENFTVIASISRTTSGASEEEDSCSVEVERDSTYTLVATWDNDGTEYNCNLADLYVSYATPSSYQGA
jgi:hypothetical protein